MAKTSIRRVTIYINGKDFKASVKQIRAEMMAWYDKLAAELGEMSFKERCGCRPI